MDFGMKILMFVLLVANITMLKAKPHREWRDVYNSGRFVRTTCSMLYSQCSGDPECKTCGEKNLLCVKDICDIDNQNGGPLYRRKRWHFIP